MAAILIVEDDGALRDDLANQLSEWGHEVFEAADGVEGFNAMVRTRPDVVLCDVMMPNENGHQLVTRAARSSKTPSGMAFIFISSLADPISISLGLTVGGDDYITKPIDYRLLRSKIDAHLRKRGTLYNRFLEDSITASITGSLGRASLIVGAGSAVAVCGLVAVLALKTIFGIDLFSDVYVN